MIVGNHLGLTVEQNSLSVEWQHISTPMYPFYMVKSRAIYIRLRTAVPMYEFLPPKIFNNPTMNFAVVIDDHLMEITHVLRGEEHITNTPKQIMIYDSFRWEKPKFGHMTIIVNKEKKKLSKRDKDVNQFISEYKEQGFIPQALFNFITLVLF